MFNFNFQDDETDATLSLLARLCALYPKRGLPGYVVVVEMDATLRVHSNIIKLINQFGEDVKGYEKEAFAIFPEN